VEGSFEILADTADTVKVVRSAAVDQWMVENIEIERFEWTRGGVLPLNIVAPRDLPMPAAFEIIVENDGTPVAEGVIWLTPAAGGEPSNASPGFLLPLRGRGAVQERRSATALDLDPNHVSILLKASTAAARKSVHIYEIWGGSLRFSRMGAVRRFRLDDTEWIAGPIRNPELVTPTTQPQQPDGSRRPD
jgi:hypothetical protein